MSTPPTVAVTSSRAVVEAAARRGVEVEALLARHAVEPALLADPRGRLPAPTVARLWQDAALTAGEPELPVWAALELPWGAYRVLDLLAASATTVGEALGLVSTWFRIVHDTIRLPIEVRPGGGGSMGIEQPDGSPVPAAYVDYTLTACICRMSYAGAAPRPEVVLRRPAPADLRAHHAAFGPRVRFGGEEDRVYLDAAQWEAPLNRGDPLLRSVLEEHAARLVADLPAPEPVDPVAAALCELLPRGRVEVDLVAERLGVSRRTLQRRLAEQGLTWSTLVERTRLRLAERLLADPALSVDEVAVLLGYAEASTFHRAFRRWTGETPGAWRARR